jgi:regulator of PEP synthase PpsR (kinase-PPPase family)
MPGVNLTVPNFAQEKIDEVRNERLTRLRERLSDASLKAVQDQISAEVSSFEKSTLLPIIPVIASEDRTSESSQALLLTQITDSYIHKCDNNIAYSSNAKISQWFENAKTVLLLLNTMNQLRDSVKLGGADYRMLMEDIFFQIDFFPIGVVE